MSDSVLYIVDGMEMLPYDTVRKGHSSPLPMGMMTAPGNQKEAGVRQNKRLAEAAAGEDGPGVLGLYLQLCRFYLWGSQAALRGWIINADFREASPLQIAAEVGFRDVDKVKRNLAELERIGLIVRAPLPDFGHYLQKDVTHTPAGPRTPKLKQRFDNYRKPDPSAGNGGGGEQSATDDTPAGTTATPPTAAGADDRGKAGSRGGAGEDAGSPPSSPPPDQADDPGPGGSADDPGPGNCSETGAPPGEGPAPPAGEVGGSIPACSGNAGGDKGHATGDKGPPRPAASADGMTGAALKTCRPAASGTGDAFAGAGTMPTGDTADAADPPTAEQTPPPAATQADHAEMPGMPTEADPGGAAGDSGPTGSELMRAFLADPDGRAAAYELAEVLMVALYAERADQVQAMRTGRSDNIEHAIAREAGSVRRTCVAARVCLADRWEEFSGVAMKKARKVMKVRKVKKSRGSLWNYEINQWGRAAVGGTTWEAARSAARRLTGAAPPIGSVPPRGPAPPTGHTHPVF